MTNEFYKIGITSSKWGQQSLKAENTPSSFFSPESDRGGSKIWFDGQLNLAPLYVLSAPVRLMFEVSTHAQCDFFIRTGSDENWQWAWRKKWKKY